MPLSPTITYRDIPASNAIQADILNKIEKMKQFCSEIMHCDVVIEQVQKQQHTGKEYLVSLNFTVPGEELVSNHHRHEDIYVAIRDAFSALRRQLQEYSARRRCEIKRHPNPIDGSIARLYKNDGFGFIEADGTEYYFSYMNLSNSDFKRLKEGMDVRFLAVEAGEGLQANRITIPRRRSG